MSYTLEISVRNKFNNEEISVDLFGGIDEVREELASFIDDEQIKEELELDVPDRDDYDDSEDYNEAVKDYEKELEEGIDDYRSDVAFEDFDNFFILVEESGTFNAGLNDFEDVENMLDKMSEVKDDYDWRAVLAIHNSTYNELGMAIDTYTSGDFYWYPDMSMEDVVEQQIDDGLWGEIPSNIRNYLDTERMARDLTHDGYSYDEEAGGVIATF